MLDLFDVLLLRKFGGGSGSGSSITVEPLTVTSNGTQTAPSGKAYSPVTVNVEPGIVYFNDGSGGGTATLANPFNGLDYGRLMNGLAADTADWNAFISFQFQGMEVLYHPFKAYYAITAMAFLPNDGQGNPVGAYAQWNENGGLNALYVLSGGQMQDLSSIAANIPCTTIIYGTTAPSPAT